MTSLNPVTALCCLLACTLAVELCSISVMRSTVGLFKELKKELPCLDSVNELLLEGASLDFEFQQGVLNAGEFVLLHDYADTRISTDLMMMFHDSGFEYNERNLVQAVLSGSFAKLAMHVFLAGSNSFLSLLRVARASRDGMGNFQVAPVLEYTMNTYTLAFPEMILEQVIDRRLHRIFPVLLSHGLIVDAQVSDLLVHSSEDMIMSAVLSTGTAEFSDFLGVRILEMAIKDGQVQLAVFLLENGADPNYCVDHPSLIKLALDSISHKDDLEQLVLGLIRAGADTRKLPKKAASILAASLYPLLVTAHITEESPLSMLPFELLLKIALNIARIEY